MVVSLRFNFALPSATVRVSGGGECGGCFSRGRERGEARAAVIHGANFVATEILLLLKFCCCL